ncbi:MAG: proprotein convertase P-domain-containing protein, partial [Myxococcota bacterium]
LCDADLDNDLDIDNSDLDLLKTAFFGSDPDADLDGNGAVDFLDLGRMASQYGGAPGPGSSTFTTSPSLAIPDGAEGGVNSTNTIVDDITILDLEVEVVISHTYIGDLTVTLTHVETGTSAVLIDQPGEPDQTFGCSGDDIEATLSDAATLPVEDECASTTPSIQGKFTPNNPLDVFDGESTAGNWKLTVSDASAQDTGTLDEWTLLVNPPPPPVEITMTAYRPQSETYSNPLQRRPILEADEESPGAGVRMNGDDDDADGIADRDDASVTGENDLIEVELGVNQLAPAGAEYVLRRTAANINVWDSASKDTAILDDEEETTLTFSAQTRSVWVENPNGGTASLEFEARSTSDSSVLASDEIYFFPFTSLLIGLHGEFQFPTDPVYGPNEGISYLAVDFHEEAYDSHMYVENEVAADGSGSVYDEIVSAIQNRGVTQIAMYGFSHGGGSIYDLSERLDANKGSIGSFDLVFTAYIDGIENDSDVDLDAEERLPIGTGYHVNYYQSSFLWWIWGASVPGADVDELVTGVSHITITNDPDVQSGIHDALVLRVAR